VESVEAAVYTEFSRFWPSLTGSIREPLLNEEGLGNTQKWPICRYLSPLPDSNRGPPPYHGGFAPLLCDLGKRLVARFPCNSAGLSACSTLSSKDPEPPRVAANLSPEPSPRKPALVVVVDNGRALPGTLLRRRSSVRAGGASRTPS
jgi:hypothetical protein